MSKKVFLNEGDVFGRLTVIREVESVLSGKMLRRFYECKCECGTITRVRLEYLRSGHTQSCGCFRVEQTINALTTHGDRKSKLYSVWAGMVSRCRNQSPRYGGRGISVCDEWNTSYSAFASWAKANGYNEHLTIDRIDNDGNYEPNNCRWVTCKIQSNNRSTNKVLSAFGEEKNISQWAEDSRCLVSFKTLHQRVTYMNWDAERAITTPSRSANQTFKQVYRQRTFAEYLAKVDFD